jgi:hypothetical protein
MYWFLTKQMGQLQSDASSLAVDAGACTSVSPASPSSSAAQDEAVHWCGSSRNKQWSILGEKMSYHRQI